MVSTRNTATQTRGGNRSDGNFRAGLYLAQREKRETMGFRERRVGFVVENRY